MKRLLVAVLLLSACKKHRVEPARAPLAVQTVSAAKNRTCVIHQGRVQCVGQLGPRVSFAPVVVPGTEGALAVDDGGLGCVILADRAVACFGAGAATRVPGVTDAVQIAAGRAHACARSSRGRLTCWGKSIVNLDGVVDVAADGDATCAVKRDGAVLCFGGSFGPAPKKIASSARKVAVHHDQACVVHQGGAVSCGEQTLPVKNARVVAFGERLRCVLDDARAVSCVEGGAVRKVLDDAVELVASPDHVCARDARGGVWCVGDDTFGQLGDRAPSDAGPRKVTDAKSWVLGGSIGCTLGEHVACFSAVPPFVAPVDVPSLAGTKVLARGRDHACAVDGAGALRCFGLARFGQLGFLGDTWSVPEPRLVADLPPVRDVAVGDLQTCATARDGRVFCFGSNASGELALGTSSLVVPAPTLVPALAGARAIALGMHHLCALLVDGTVSCAGSNGSGELGHAGPSSPLLVKVPGLDQVVELGLRDRHSCARRDDGALLCWGARFGDPEATTNGKDEAPRSIAGKAISLGVGRAHACFVREGGDVLCWGDNRDGACGSPIGEPLAEPRVVLGIHDAVEVRAGDRTSCARTVKDEIWCWGNDRVEGVPATVTRGEPVAMRL